MEALIDVIERLEHRATKDPRLDQYRCAPRPARDLDRFVASIAPLRLPDDLDHLLRSGGFWPGELLPLPDPVSTFTDVLSGWNEDAPQRVWANFATTWERDHCYTPLLSETHATAPVGMFSSQMLSVSVPVPSIAAMLECFEVAIEVLGLDQDDLDPTWCDLITEPPQPDPERSEEATRRHLALHQRLGLHRQTWTSAHPCWLDEAMPLAWTEDPPAAVVEHLLGR